MRRLPPGQVPAALWAHVPDQVGDSEWRADPKRLPALWSEAPSALMFLALAGEDLALHGPYGDVDATPQLVEEAVRIAVETRRRGLVAFVRNDEAMRLDALQRLGFILREARVGAIADAPARSDGGIPIRDLLVLTRTVGAG
jgi:hypothetical protein